jgi:hypothetical protein
VWQQEISCGYNKQVVAQLFACNSVPYTLTGLERTWYSHWNHKHGGV